MKKFRLLALSIASLLPFSFTHGQTFPPVNLELVSSATGLPTETVTPLNTIFTLDIAVQDPSGIQSLRALEGFDITLAALPTGLTFDGFSNLISNFAPNPAPDGALSYSADITGTIPPDVTIGAIPTTLLQATFTATNTLALGSHTLDFIVPGLDQGLDDPTGARISYQDILDTLIVAPEPGSVNLLFLGLAAVGLLPLIKRLEHLLSDRRSSFDEIQTDTLP